MNEETIQAARAAFKRDPETACQAMLGCSAEEMFVTALRGCNQHKHKPGCPDADGGGEQGEDKESRSAEMFEKLKHGKHTLPNGDKVSIVNEAINGGRKLLFLDKGGKLELIGRFEKDGYLLPVEGNPYKITRRGGEL